MKVPTKHGLDRKFKPWRKGKSSNSNKRSSLKQQLRGHERLLAKILKNAEKDPSQKLGDDQKTKDLRKKITELKQEISHKQQSMVEKKHAEKSHGQRFLDRQRLTRQEKKARKIVSKDQEERLLKIALDQIYVAHHPNDVKYMPLFKYGKRVVDQSRQLFRRAVTRKRILRDINSTTKVSWISADQYERLPKNEWTIEDEEHHFGGSVSRSTSDNTKSIGRAEDSRFAIASKHEALLKAADQAESDLLQDEEKSGEKMSTTEKCESMNNYTKNDSNSSSSESSSDSEDEEPDPLSSKQSTKSNSGDGRQSSISEVKNTQQNVENDDSTSDSDSSSSDDSDREIGKFKQNLETDRNSKRKNTDSDSSSSSSTSSVNSDTKAEKKTPYKETSTTTYTGEVVDEEIDDFLIDATNNHDVFSQPAVRVPALSAVRGDKSKGFETQSQRPGEFRKKRKRRY
mmetsp:Transcript_23086/g.54563  ORF Transcript_23086/g.54563 Transcript_23086/m.54563 type:complete len:456 (+) Transcript_23086:70-1437(+)